FQHRVRNLLDKLRPHCANDVRLAFSNPAPPLTPIAKPLSHPRFTALKKRLLVLNCRPRRRTQRIAESRQRCSIDLRSQPNLHFHVNALATSNDDIRLTPETNFLI